MQLVRACRAPSEVSTPVATPRSTPRSTPRLCSRKISVERPPATPCRAGGRGTPLLAGSRTPQRAMLEWQEEDRAQQQELTETIEALYRHRKATLRFLRRCEDSKELLLLQKLLDPQPRRVRFPGPGPPSGSRPTSARASSVTCGGTRACRRSSAERASQWTTSAAVKAWTALPPSTEGGDGGAEGAAYMCADREPWMIIGG